MLTNEQIQQLARWQQSLQASRQRGFLQLQGEPEVMRQLAQDICQQFFDADVYQNEQAFTMNRVKALLGQEFSAVVFDAYQGFHSNAFAALAGTVKAGGLFILIAPDFYQSTSFDDPDYKRWQATDHVSFSGAYLSYVQDCFDASKQAVVKSNNNELILTLPNIVEAKACAIDFTEQEQAVAAVKRVVTGHAKRPQVLLGDRGRGKSTCLAIACAQLLQEAKRNIVICAVHQSALNSFYQHFCRLTDTEACDVIELSNGSTLKFLPPDQLLKYLPQANAVFIDEAATISTFQLEEIVSVYNRIVFASTVHGYEGNGRGFLLRFSKTLTKLMPQWKSTTLTKAIRFSEDDALEQLVNDVFVLDANIAEIDVDAIAKQNVSYHSISQYELAQDKALLKQMFSLLVNAHYQTSPDDLRLLLDHPDAKVLYASIEGKVVAALLLMQEGGLDVEDIAALQQGRRRFRGHILPQQLFLNGFDQVLSLRFIRVVRIATHPDVRRMHIASELLAFAKSQYSTDFFGASFACASELLPFWQQAGFVPVLLGQQKESASGCYSCVFLQALSNEAQSTLVALRLSFQQQLLWQLREFTSHDLLVIGCLLKGLHFEISLPQKQQVLNVLEQRCHWQSVRKSLWQVACLVIAAGDFLSWSEQLLLFNTVLLNKPLSALQSLEITTQQQRDDALRAMFEKIFDKDLL